MMPVKEIAPFRAAVPDAELADLRDRLGRTRWPDSVAGAGWDYGASLEYLRELAGYWRDAFDWRAQEAAINRLENYTVEVGGLVLHFLHARGRGPRPLPLLLGHGWPGSFLEMLELAPRLADPAAFGGDAGDAFDVVVPSLPGFGFSQRPPEAGMSSAKVADLMAGLMERLGYRRFGAQGGDWGAGIATWLALRHPQRMLGIHLNYIPGSYAPHVCGELAEAEREFLAGSAEWSRREYGYGHLQATRPQTAAFALHDSPVGLLAWIVEKFRDWSDCDGEVERRFSKDQLLANVTLYWLTGTIHSSMRLYYESARAPLALAPGQRVGVPCGVARFPREEPMPPREWVERGYQVVRWSEMPRGGHFAAMEEPELLAADVRAFFRPLRDGIERVR